MSIKEILEEQKALIKPEKETINDIKKRSLDICVAIGCMSTP